MYLTQVHLENIRCFEDVTINFRPPTEQNASWALVLGDNGTGKTSVLRCIAIGLCDETTASGLVREIKGELVRSGEETAVIKLRLEDSEDQRPYELTTIIRRTESGREEVEQKATRGFPWNKVFACGYGSARQYYGSEPYDRFRIDSAFYTLFTDGSPLQNPELALLKLIRLGTSEVELLQRLDHVLMLPPGSTRFERASLVISGPWGEFMPFGAVADGYRATLAWIADLLGWSMLFRREQFDVNVAGIVLIDEIEEHLHPSWQREIIGRLRMMFPLVQFISTTHAPLCAIGSAQLRDDECQLVLLERGKHFVKARAGLAPPRWRRADQVLTSYLFGLPSTSSDDVTYAIEQYAQLCQKKQLGEEETQKLSELRDRLDQVFDKTETKLQAVVKQAVSEALRRLADEAVSNGELDWDSLDYEMKRQIAELMQPNGDDK